MLEKDVLEQEKILEKFNLEKYISNQDYKLYGILSALDVTNEIQKNYFKDITSRKTIDYKLIRLYGLLQSLFVSVDALYELCGVIVGNKKFININSNEKLRELRYIRNDIVGHPANRTYRQKGYAYCVLDKENLTDTKISYKIYSKNNVILKDINLIDLIKAYYIESNSLLLNLYNLSNIDLTNKESCNLNLSKLLFQASEDIKNVSKYLDQIKQIYEDFYKLKQSRFLYRISLINEILDFYVDKELYELKLDIIFIQISKMYHIINNQDILKDKYSDIYYKINEFLNDDYRKFYIQDINHPMFLKSLLELINEAKDDIKIFFETLKSLYNDKKDRLVYCFTLVIN